MKLESFKSYLPLFRGFPRRYRGWCPITYVCFLLTGKRFPARKYLLAAEELHLSSADVKRLADWADCVHDTL